MFRRAAFGRTRCSKGFCAGAGRDRVRDGLRTRGADACLPAFADGVVPLSVAGRDRAVPGSDGAGGVADRHAGRRSGGDGAGRPAGRGGEPFAAVAALDEFEGTIGGSAIPLHERVIKALSDITESPGGILFLRGEDGDFEPVALANWAGKTGRIPEGMSDIFVEQALVLDLEQSRGGSNVRGELEMVPDWMLADECAWAAVPLIHFDRLAGIVVLARPEFRRELDWEDFDLLRVVGRQLASYLAEEASQASLQEASRFDEFNRRMAFVMHDIKNLSSQLTLLLRNAEKHADKPEFRSDMLVTLRSSADKLNAMLARLGRYAQSSPQRRREVDLASAARAVCARYAGSHPVAMVRSDEVRAEVDPEALEQALAHIVQNAVEASDERAAVLIEVVNEGLSGRITVTDTGEGMEPAFLRNGLFKPFTSTKEGGFGIGAFEARETIKAMGGRLDVESHPGLGTRFTLSFPASAMGRLAAAQPEAA
ncbi:MAG: PEP-CTERM system histidine kinase PrsK [Citromicrobium sp.]|nr:MAG: PEP-CTERM system histidine kinase PrsK [Citromicrobium sp.]